MLVFWSFIALDLFFLYKSFFLFFFYGCTGSSFALLGRSLISASRGLLFLAVHGFLIVEASLMVEI